MQGKAGLWVPPCLGECACCWSLAAGISLFPRRWWCPPLPKFFLYIVSVDDAVGFRSHHRNNDPEADCRPGHRCGRWRCSGLLFGLCPKIEDVGTPLIHVLQAIPPVCWVVLALVWFGFNGKPCVFIVAHSHSSNCGDQPQSRRPQRRSTAVGDGRAFTNFPAGRCCAM